MSGERNRGFVVLIVIVSLTLVADLFTVAAGVAAGSAKFPPPFHIIQQHPWWSLLVLSLVGSALAVGQQMLSRSGGKTPSSARGDAEVVIEGSNLRWSPINVLRGTRTWISRSRIRKSPITIHESGSPDSQRRSPADKRTK
jgi:hypothetical protein